MTPTTRPWYIEELEKHWGEGVMSFDTRRAAKTAIDQVEALTKERDEYRQAADTQAAAHKVERDALAANHKDCVRCLGEALQDRADLAAAAKLALDSIECALSFVEHAYRPPVPDRIEIGRMVYIRLHSLASLKETADALRQAGVQ